MKTVADFDLRRYIGHSYEEMNCLQLVQEFYHHEFGLEIQNYFEGEVPDRQDVEVLIKSNKGKFIEVPPKEIQYGDIVVIKLYGIECHLGVVIAGTKFLHSAKNIGSNIDRLERYARLIVGYYRHSEATA
jgi:cell wall-associated NlpC family hydrolase